jgi:PKD repeat protein/sugar lactone lactonase YvrE
MIEGRFPFTNADRTRPWKASSDRKRKEKTVKNKLSNFRSVSVAVRKLRTGILLLPTFALSLVFATNAAADVTAVVVTSSTSLGTFRGKPYLEIKGTMLGTVVRPDLTTGDYAVPITLDYPADPADGNGFGIVEPLHQSLLRQAIATIGADSLFGNGYVYAVMAWDKTDTNTNVVVAQLSDAWQILRDAASLLRQPGGLYQNLTVPAPSAVPTIIAFGLSRSGLLLRGFVASGRNADLVFDGLLITEAGAVCLNLDGAGRNYVVCQHPLPADGRIIAVNTEYDVERSQGWLARPDPAVPTPNFRLYELAGVPHIDKSVLDFTSIGATRQNPASPGPVFRAMLAHLRAWITAGDEPPPSVVMPGEVGDLPAGDLVVPAVTACQSAVPPCPIFYFVRDGHGNAEGGVRLPHMVAPLGTYTGVETNFAAVAPPTSINTNKVADGGTFTPFNQATLNALYPHPGDYASAVAVAANDARQAGWILTEDALAYEPLNIVTVAGRSIFTADGGPATSGKLNAPEGIALDAAGNLYIADSNTKLVRKVDAVTGIITSVAGTGFAGFSGDGGPATNAALAGCRGLAFDLSGNLYIVDISNQRIRKVAAGTGLISTVAGTGVLGFNGDSDINGLPRLATNAHLAFPESVVADPAGNLYFSEANNSRVRRVDALTGLISTVAGGNAKTATAILGSANLTVADTNGLAPGIAVFGTGIPTGTTIASLDSTTSITLSQPATRSDTTTLTTIAAGFSGDGGPATAARFFMPQGIALDASGNLYIADNGNNRVRFVNLTDQEVTLAVLDPGTGLPMVVAPGNIATVAGAVPGINGDGIAATAANLTGGLGVALDAAGNLYIADTFFSSLGHNRIRRVDAATGLITTVVGSGSRGFNGDGIAATNANLSGPSYGLVLDAAGNIYFADFRVNRIRFVNRTNVDVKLYPAANQPLLVAPGNIATVAGGASGPWGEGGPATAANLNSPTLLAFDASANLHFCDAGNNIIRKLDPATGLITTVAGGNARTATTIKDDTTVTLTDTNGLSRGIFVFGAGIPDGATIVSLDSTTSITLSQPATVSDTTTLTTSAASFSGDGGPATAAQLNGPAGLDFDAAGNLYLADTGNQRIRKVEQGTGIITTVAGTSISGFNGDVDDAGNLLAATDAWLDGPQGPAMDAAGNLYFADSGNNRVRFVNLSGLEVTLFPGAAQHLVVAPGTIATVAGGNARPATTIMDSTNVTLTATNGLAPGIAVFGPGIPLGATIVSLDSTTSITLSQPATRDGTTTLTTLALGASGNGGPATAAMLNDPRSVTLDASGNLYLSDGFNRLVRRVDTVTGIITTSAGRTGQLAQSPDGSAATNFSFNSLRQVVADDASASLYVTDAANCRLHKLAPPLDGSGILTTMAGTPAGLTPVGGFNGDGLAATAALLNRPEGVALDPARNLYIGDSGNCRIRRLNVAAKAVSVRLNAGGAGGVDALVELYGLRDPNTLASVTLRTIDSRGQPTSDAFPGTDGGPDTGDPQKHLFSFGPNATLLAGLTFRLEGLFTNDGRTFSGDTLFPFTGEPTSGVAPLSVSFTNLYTGAASYTWDFGDGDSTTIDNPTHIYTNAGSYSVTLTAIGAGGTNSLTRINYIVVTNPPPPVVADFAGEPTNGIAPLSVSFTNLSSGAASYTWDLGDGNSTTNDNPANTYTSAGSYSVTLTAIGAGGTNALTRTNYIVVINPTLVVTPASLDFGLLVPGATAQASFVISNAGVATLEGSATLDTGPFTILSGTPFSLEESGTTNLIVSFDPVAPGSFSNLVLFTCTGGSTTNTILGRAASAPLLVLLTADGAEFTFSFDTVSGLTYLVQFKDSLDDPIWQTSESVLGDGTLKTITTILSSSPQRFFRLWVQ